MPRDPNYNHRARHFPARAARLLIPVLLIAAATGCSTKETKENSTSDITTRGDLIDLTSRTADATGAVWPEPDVFGPDPCSTPSTDGDSFSVNVIGPAPGDLEEALMRVRESWTTMGYTAESTHDTTKTVFSLVVPRQPDGFWMKFDVSRHAMVFRADSACVSADAPDD